MTARTISSYYASRRRPAIDSATCSEGFDITPASVRAVGYFLSIFPPRHIRLSKQLAHVPSQSFLYALFCIISSGHGLIFVRANIVFFALPRITLKCKKNSFLVGLSSTESGELLDVKTSAKVLQSALRS